MKIDRTNIKGPAGAYRTIASRPVFSQQGTAGSKGAATADKVDVSNKAKQASALKAKLQSAPEVRIELVQRLKAQIDAGKYSVDPHKVAEKLLKSKILDE